jgi:hypothetical protein
MIGFYDFMEIVAQAKPIYAVRHDYTIHRFNPNIYEVIHQDDGKNEFSIGRMGGEYFPDLRCFWSEGEAKAFVREELTRLLEEYK